ncbi:MAG TPA: (d)CMP kinase [Candidatus Omnitrophota bacterium]|nr:(d)CMP kinase [Candidatus Omnitrophota bacterium]HRZ15065.1 (d)CMP kinase [Candidatus Omnitrophota bacterium]
MIIAVDGPAGGGKSTVAKILAKKLGFLYIDTGAMYRALTRKALDQRVAIGDETAMTALAQKTAIELIPNPDGPITVLLDGKDVSLAIREPAVTQHVSDVAKIKGVRQVMLILQRKLGAEHDCIMDGRDIGTTVFPQAQKKFFIDATFDERVNRRFKDLINLNIKGVSREEVAADLKNRDTIDSTRECAPLRKAEDAVYIDTTTLSIDQVVETMLRTIR